MWANCNVAWEIRHSLSLCCLYKQQLNCLLLLDCRFLCKGLGSEFLQRSKVSLSARGALRSANNKTTQQKFHRMELNAIVINKQQEINKISLNKGSMTFILHSISHLHNCKYKKKSLFLHQESQLQNKSSCPQPVAVDQVGNTAPVILLSCKFHGIFSHPLLNKVPLYATVRIIKSTQNAQSLSALIPRHRKDKHLFVAFAVSTLTGNFTFNAPVVYSFFFSYTFSLKNTQIIFKSSR